MQCKQWQLDGLALAEQLSRQLRVGQDAVTRSEGVPVGGLRHQHGWPLFDFGLRCL
jgi:hypothetical protein